MIPIPFNTKENMDVVEVFDKPYLFTNMRIDRGTIPEGAVAYDVRDNDCDGEFCQIKDYVLVNHWGTIIGFDPIENSAQGRYIEPDDWGFTGEYYNFEEFKEKVRELKCAKP